jgi:putative ABC transport system ATP-binding protein
LGALLKRYPEQLSGGQQQRVAIGRALASRPGLLLADEPTGNLDENTSDEVLQLLLDLLADSPTSLLMVTHSPRVAARLDRQEVLHLGRLATEGER